METAKKNDFIELKYTGYVNGKAFDSNIEEDLKEINPKAKVQKTIIVVGQGMIVKGVDSALEGKEVGKEYKVTFPAKDGFGDRRKDMVKTIPLKVFTERKINPEAGMAFALDDMLVKVLAVSGARVIADFNNPLAGKELEYKFTVVRKIADEDEKCRAIFGLLFKVVPEFEIKDKVIVR